MVESDHGQILPSYQRSSTDIHLTSGLALAGIYSIFLFSNIKGKHKISQCLKSSRINFMMTVAHDWLIQSRSESSLSFGPVFSLLLAFFPPCLKVSGWHIECKVTGVIPLLMFGWAIISYHGISNFILKCVVS